MQTKTRTTLHGAMVLAALLLVVACADNASSTGTTPSGDTTAPTVTGTVPADAATAVALNASIAVTFSEAMDTAATEAALASSPALTGTVAWSGGDTVLTFTPASPLAAATSHTVTLGTGATDVAGNALAADYVFAFTTGSTTDITAPTVTGTVPADAATAIALNASIAVTFSEAMDTAATEAAFASSPALTGAFAWSAGNTVLTFAPASPLAAVTTHTVTLGTGARDTAGNALASPYSFAFTTGSVADTVAPTITGTVPADSATAIALSTTVTVTFSEAMDTAATEGAFSISPVVTGAFAWSAGNTVLTFTPASPLAAATAYTVTLGTGARDTAGNALSGTNNFGFTTVVMRTLTLTVTKSGSATGTYYVTVTPGGSQCSVGEVCTLTFADGTSITLTPNTYPIGSLFSGECAIYYLAPCPLTLDADKAITYTFAVGGA